MANLDLLGSLAYFGVLVGAAYPTLLAVSGLHLSSTQFGFWRQYKYEVVTNFILAVALDVSLLYLALRNR